jgi:hypothetical protein
MRALRTHIRQGRAIGCGIALLISLATACSSSGSQASDSTTPTDLGAPCADASTCTSNKCQALAANDRNIPGLCSALCTSPKGCGPSGACVAETVSGDNVCLRSCASPSDCHPGIPCIWDSAVDGGVCVPVPSGICANFGLEGGCGACLAANCCGELEACSEDLGCGKLEQACKTVCMGPLSNAPAQALSACAASSCASICR